MEIPIAQDLAPEQLFQYVKPRELLTRNAQLLDEVYLKLLTDGRARAVEKKFEKLWCLFDLALQSTSVDFILAYLNGQPPFQSLILLKGDCVLDVCFSPELVQFGCDAYFHSTRVILDWCHKFHTEAEELIKAVMKGNDHQNLANLPHYLQSLIEILKHCLSKSTADATRAASRSVLVTRLIHTTQGLQLAVQVALWNIQEDRCLQQDVYIEKGLPSDSYLASQNLPLLWLEQYPFSDVCKAMDILFFNHDVISREELKLSKLAVFGFYILHTKIQKDLHFLSKVFHLSQEMVSLWEGLFLIDLSSYDPHFQEPEIKIQAAEALKASNPLHQTIPIETLIKMQSLGLGLDAKQLFMRHKKTYFESLDNKIVVARQGLVFCLSSGDLRSGLEICRDALMLFPTSTEGVPLLRNYFDQILGNGKLQDLVIMNFTPFEERMFIDWAGNKRDDPECSLYLTLYFLRKSDIESAEKLYHLHKTNATESTHQDLWDEIGLALSMLSTKEPTDQQSSEELMKPEASMTMEDDISYPSSEEAERDKEFYNLLETTKDLLPASLNFVLHRSTEKVSSLMPCFSEPFSSKHLCPLHQNQETETDEDVFFDASEN